MHVETQVGSGGFGWDDREVGHGADEGAVRISLVSAAVMMWMVVGNALVRR